MIAEYDLLLCLQGTPESERALDYGLHLAEKLRRPVTVLGIHRQAKRNPLVDEQVLQANRRLVELGISSQTEHAFGRLAEVVPPYTVRKKYFTIFNAPPHNLLQHWMQGGRFRHLLASIKGPMLQVSGGCWPIERILVSTGGLSYANPHETLATELAGQIGAGVVFLHVVPPVTLDYRLAQDVAHHWEKLLDTDTPQAQHLRAALESARTAGVEASVKLRHGQIVDEILAELNTGDYDMIALGSPYAGQSLARLYRPNVTAAVAEEASCPLLTIHV